MFKNFAILNICHIFVHKLKTCNTMNTIKTTRQTAKIKFTNAKSENDLIIKHRSETTNLFVSLIEYKPQN